jgi:hypothetical protein
MTASNGSAIIDQAALYLDRLLRSVSSVGGEGERVLPNLSFDEPRPPVVPIENKKTWLNVLAAGDVQPSALWTALTCKPTAADNKAVNLKACMVQYSRLLETLMDAQATVAPATEPVRSGGGCANEAGLRLVRIYAQQLQLDYAALDSLLTCASVRHCYLHAVLTDGCSPACSRWWIGRRQQ